MSSLLAIGQERLQGARVRLADAEAALREKTRAAAQATEGQIVGVPVIVPNVVRMSLDSAFADIVVARNWSRVVSARNLAGQGRGFTD